MELHILTNHGHKVLHLDSSNMEAIASLASNYFYSDQPEIAYRYYRRLIQVIFN
jgi:tetratricopeptide repeat protein 8